MDEIKKLFLELKKGHDVLVGLKEGETKRNLIDSFDFYFVELEKLGVPRHFSEAIFFFGKEFLDYEYPSNSEVSTTQPVEVQPNVQVQQGLDSSDSKVIHTQSVEDQSNRPATIEDAERIFGVKATPMDEIGIRESALAEKNNAIAWESKSKSKDQIAIKPLIIKKDGKLQSVPVK